MFEAQYIVVFLTISVAAVEYSRINEGYPVGLISDCPGSWKPAVIKPQTLNKLYVSVLSDSFRFSGAYNYYGMDQLAKNPDLDFKKKTWIYVGGYLDSNAWNSGRFMGFAYKALGYNVLSLDTLHFTANFYPRAARFSRAIGKHVAEMLVQLTRQGLDPKKLEITGLSLGAHIMSFTAKSYREMTGQNISTLIALDHAGPCYRHLGPEERIDKSDADFVASIVTSMDIYGISFPFAHITFYVNGGAFQEGHYSWFPCDSVCSHARSYFIWWSAVIHPGDFIGVRCDTMQQARDGKCYNLKPMVTNTMDLLMDKTKTGIYYIRTSNRWPFALGNRGLNELKVSPKISSSIATEILMLLN